MKKTKILALDQGTTGSTAALYTLSGKFIASENLRFKQNFPKTSWVEHRPADILRSLKKAIKNVLEKSKTDPHEILTIGITNQRETVAFWDKKTGKPFGNAIVWQCRRTSARTEKIKKTSDAKWIFKKTGLNVDPYFSSTKIEWFLKQATQVQKKNLQVGTIDAFLLYNLTAGKSFYTEPSNASRTQLYNIKDQHWDKDLLKFFKIPQDVLPEVLDSNANFGTVKNFKPLIDGTPIQGILGDQQSALFGHGAFKSGQVKCTFGTGSFILLNTGTKLKFSTKGLLSTVAWKLKGQKTYYALEGGAFNCGSAIDWFVKTLGVVKSSKDLEKKAQEVLDSGGVFFAPTFSGLGAPYWSPETKGAFIGLTRGVEKGHLVRALFEGLSFQNKLIFDSLASDYQKKLGSIYIDGGASQNNLFMETQSLFAQAKLFRPQNIETTSLGAALMAGLGARALNLKKMDANPTEKTFYLRPKKEDGEKVRAYAKFFKALNQEPFSL